MEHEGDSDTNCNLCVRNDPQKLDKETGRVENRRSSRDYSIVKIDLNTEMGPEDMRILALTQTPGKNHLLTLVRKTSKEYYNDNDNENWKKRNCRKNRTTQSGKH